MFFQDNRKSLFMGLFFLSVSVLMVEIVSTRVAKILFGHTFQFLIFSLALLGIGIGSIAVYFFHSRIGGLRSSVLFRLSSLYLLFLILSFLSSHFKELLTSTPTKILFFIGLFILYFLYGVIVALFFASFRRSYSWLYFCLMAGSALGSFSIILLLDAFGISKAILSLAAITLLVLFFFDVVFPTYSGYIVIKGSFK